MDIVDKALLPGEHVPAAYRPRGLSALLRTATAGNDLTPLGEQLLEYTKRHDDPAALLDLSLVLELKYQRESALAVQSLAIQTRRQYRIREARPGSEPVRVLALKAPGDLMANTPFECVLDDAGPFQVDVVYIDGQPGDLPPLPEHDVVLVAACASDANAPVLARIGELLSEHPRAVLNPPQGIALTTRDAAYALLSKTPGIRMAHTVRLPRAQLHDAARGAWPLSDAVDGDFPFIVRPVGSHAGQGLEKVADAHALADYLQGTVADEYYVAPFIDYSGADGLFRKYRIVLIEGKPFLCHMGISAHWMVHYPYPEMIAHPERRQEEADLMANFDATFARRHEAALAAVAQRTGLHYVGFDCAETADGQLLIFEIATGMVIHDMDDEKVFPYKRPNMHRVFAAFHEMLKRAALALPAPSTTASGHQ